MDLLELLWICDIWFFEVYELFEWFECEFFCKLWEVCFNDKLWYVRIVWKISFINIIMFLIINLFLIGRYSKYDEL